MKKINKQELLDRWNAVAIKSTYSKSDFVRACKNAKICLLNGWKTAYLRFGLITETSTHIMIDKEKLTLKNISLLVNKQRDDRRAYRLKRTDARAEALATAEKAKENFSDSTCIDKATAIKFLENCGAIILFPEKGWEITITKVRKI